MSRDRLYSLWEGLDWISVGFGLGYLVAFLGIVWGTFALAALVGAPWYVAATILVLIGQFASMGFWLDVFGDHLDDIFFALSRDVRKEIRDIRDELSHRPDPRDVN